MLASILYRFSGLRKLPLVVIIFFFIAFIINLTLLLGGFKPGALEHASMLTVSAPLNPIPGFPIPKPTLTSPRSTPPRSARSNSPPPIPRSPLATT